MVINLVMRGGRRGGWVVLFNVVGEMVFKSRCWGVCIELIQDYSITGVHHHYTYSDHYHHHHHRAT